MANVKLDTGTDAKITKSQNRDIELIDLASIGPAEVWGLEEERER